MGTTEQLIDAPPEQRRPMWTPGMRGVLVVVGLLVALSIAGMLWLWSQASGVDAQGGAGIPDAPGIAATGAAPTPAPTPVDGSEVLPPESDAGQSRLPARTPPTPRASAPLPPSAQGAEDLVPGFPTDLLAPTEGSTVIVNSLASDRSSLQAALRARTDADPAAVLDHYRSVWAAQGLVGGESGSGSDLAYSDAYSSVALSVAQTATGTVYTLFATLKTG